MTPTPTPRTDAAVSAGGHQLLNVANVARELERENARLKEELNDLIEGRRVVLPKNEKHARQMVIVAGACANLPPT